MALQQDDTTTPAPAFQWGANGAQLTPDQVAARRKVADAMMQEASDYSPIRSVWQGVARAAKGIVGGLQARDANQAEQANADSNKAMIAALLGQGGAGSGPAALAAAPALVAAAPAADTTGKIYSNDEPSPMDPPSGQDRTRMIATILGEAGNEPQIGKNAVASVIRTRAVDGGYGGDTPSAVVTAPNQFEPWNTPEGRARMAAASADPQQVAAANAAIASAYGEGGKAPDDPTEGMTHFYSPAGQAAMGRAAPAWAGGESVTIGGHVFNSPDDAPGKPVQVASAGPVTPGVATVAAAQGDLGALPANAAPTQGYAIPGQSAAPAAVAKVSGALGNVSPAVMQALTSPYSNDATKKIAGLVLAQQMTPKDVHTQETDKDGNVWDVNKLTGQRTVALQGEKSTPAQKDFEYGQTHPDFVRQQLERTKAGAAQLNSQNNIDMGTSQTYDKQLAEGLGKAHASLANGVEDAQTRARDVAAMQGAVDAIQKNGGTTGGLAPAQRLELQKSINAGAAALGIEKPFNESDLSDKEFLTKFNRSMAGAQAKNAVGSRVTNFEMSNFLKANPGLDMTVTGNQRLLGIQGQIEQRNIAVGNSIRDATAQAISTGKKIDPVTVQGIITEYDKAHHIQDPTTGQDLTQSYALPEFQQAGQGTNAALAVGHETNIGNIKIKRIN
ncbi:MAG: hypothetical protein JWP25_1167 [Bradyrhizobium sp.]|nr:hypothetical protein [Bradyrhizobium sp.]